MVANNDSKWKRSVAKVFDTRPRIATGKETIWLKRVDAMRGLDQAASRPGAHVCLDGPTGAGKTSLALSYLVEHQIRYVPVQVTKELDWKEHPTAAHVLGVAMREPERFKRIAELQRGRQPLSDHFPIQDDDDNDDDAPYRSAYL